MAEEPAPACLSIAAQEKLRTLRPRHLRPCPFGPRQVSTPLRDAPNYLINVLRATKLDAFVLTGHKRTPAN